MSKPEPFSNELISAYLDGELPESQRNEVEQMLDQSEEHRNLLDDLLSLRADLQALPRYRLDDDFSNRVLQRAEREMLSRGTAPAPSEPDEGTGSVASDRGTWRGLIWAAVAVAAALLIMLLGPDRVKRGDNGPQQPDGVVEQPNADDADGPKIVADDADGPKIVADDPTGEGDIVAPDVVAPGPGTIEPRSPRSMAAVDQRPPSEELPEMLGPDVPNEMPTPEDESGDAAPLRPDRVVEQPGPTDQSRAMVNMVEVEEKGGLLYVVELTFAAKDGEKGQLDSSPFDKALAKHRIEYDESLSIDSRILATIRAQLKKQRPGRKCELIYVEASADPIDALIRECTKGLPTGDGRVARARSDLATPGETANAPVPNAPVPNAPVTSHDGSSGTPQTTHATGPEQPTAADSSEPQEARPAESSPPLGAARRLDPVRLQAEAAASDADHRHVGPLSEEALFKTFGALFILRSSE